MTAPVGPDGTKQLYIPPHVRDQKVKEWQDKQQIERRVALGEDRDFVTYTVTTNSQVSMLEYDKMMYENSIRVNGAGSPETERRLKLYQSTLDRELQVSQVQNDMIHDRWLKQREELKKTMDPRDWTQLNSLMMAAHSVGGIKNLPSGCRQLVAR